MWWTSRKQARRPIDTEVCEELLWGGSSGQEEEKGNSGSIESSVDVGSDAFHSLAGHDDEDAGKDNNEMAVGACDRQSGDGDKTPGSELASVESCDDMESDSRDITVAVDPPLIWHQLVAVFNSALRQNYVSC
ncbi:hypothetical protein DVH05_010686 [Phytophthora capsici]|nr:hypothetical protein DVH05_010686 [Phytophthora capsici]